MPQEVGFIGLGNMGGPMATNLARAGYRLHVFDVQQAAVERLAGLGGVRPAAGAGEVAGRAEVVFTALPNDEIVTRTYLDDGGILSGGRGGLITCDCSTVSAETTRRIHAAARERGIHHLDTPMLGSQPQAVSGEVFFIVAGDEAQAATVGPLLEVMGKLHMYVGASGRANQIKLIHNVLGAVNSVAAAESLAMCVAAGVDPAMYARVVNNGGGMAHTTYFGKRAERVLSGDFSPQFTVELMHKDVSLAMEMARGSAAPVPIMERTLEAYGEALEGGWRHEDFSGVTHVIEGRLGRKLSGK